MVSSKKETVNVVPPRTGEMLRDGLLRDRSIRPPLRDLLLSESEKRLRDCVPLPRRPIACRIIDEPHARIETASVSIRRIEYHSKRAAELFEGPSGPPESLPVTRRDPSFRQKIHGTHADRHPGVDLHGIEARSKMRAEEKRRPERQMWRPDEKLPAVDRRRLHTESNRQIGAGGRNLWR